MIPGSWKKLTRNYIGMIALIVVSLYFVSAVAMEFYAWNCKITQTIPNYQRSDDTIRYMPPSKQHWLGTDYQGRDVFWRMVAGSATALKVGIISGLIAVIIGVSLGIVSGFYGSWIDDWTVWLFSIFSALPTLLFILAFALLVSPEFLSPKLLQPLQITANCLNSEPGMLSVYLGIGFTGWVTLCRVVRSEVLKLRNAPYVAAAKVLGLGNMRIIFRHILPNVIHLVIIYFTLLFASSVMLEVIVSYLGLGARSTPSWGVMIANGQERLWRGIWWEITSATGAMFFLILALNILGDALRDVLDPKH